MLLRSDLRTAKLYCASAYQGLRWRRAFADVEAYCMFIGYPRSGHSLVGALLDAHPHMIIAHEADALKFVKEGFNRLQLYSLLLERSQRFVASGSVWTGYSYKVPNQWNGRFEKLRIIGDKKGANSTRRLTRQPDLLHRLRRTVKVPVKLVHVVRNSYDNISTICGRQRDLDLRTSADLYFDLCIANTWIRAAVQARDCFDLRLEDLVANPRRCLAELCCFLGVESTPDYLDACSSLVFPSPRQSRRELIWSDELKASVQARIDRFPFLQGYRYEA